MSAPIQEIELQFLCSRISVGLAMAVTPYMAATGVKLIRNQNIKPNKFDDSSVIFLDPSFASSQAKKTILENDVVIVRTGANIGDACVVPENFHGAQSFTTLIVRTNTKQLSPQYLAQYINSTFGRSEVDRLMAGGGKGNLNSGELERFRIKLLPIEQQERVEKLLGTWDSAIEKTKQLIAEKERRHARLVHFLIVKPQARKSWNAIRFGSVVAERNERSGQRNQYPVLTSSRRGLFLQAEYFSRQVSSEDNTGYKVMHHGDFTFRSMSDDGRFTFNRLSKLDAGVISPAYGVFYAVRCNPEFLTHFLNSSYFTNMLDREVQGGTRKALRFSGVAQVEIDFPSEQQQNHIARILDSSLIEIESEKRRSELFQSQKRGLMQKLLTGQWRLKDVKEVAA